MRPSDRPRHETLSDREFQVLQLMGAGKSPTEIAAALSLSVKTVSTYRARMLEKLALKSSAEIIQYAIQNRLGPAGIAPGRPRPVVVCSLSPSVPPQPVGQTPTRK